MSEVVFKNMCDSPLNPMRISRGTHSVPAPFCMMWLFTCHVNDQLYCIENPSYLPSSTSNSLGTSHCSEISLLATPVPADPTAKHS